MGAKEQHRPEKEILKIIEVPGKQVFYQNDKDWRYLKEERRWVSINDRSTWWEVESVDGKLETNRFYIG